MNYLYKIVLSFFLFLSVSGLKSQTYNCNLYGSITTVDGDIYKGPIRWNDEEVFLTDIFNSQKIENPYLKYLGNKDRSGNDYKRSNRWFNDEASQSSRYARKFECRFGDIKSLSVTGYESVNLELNTGKFINLSGGSNDLGNSVWILDHELGLIKVAWNRIDLVNFFTPDVQATESFGDPIYGKITSTIGEFEGFIQWDHDERLLSDKLDGRSKDGDVNIPFDRIKKIQKTKYGSLISLSSGREFELKNSNDVTSQNRGIIVTISGVGRIDFTWKHFLSLELLPIPKGKINCYSEFKKTERLYGKVTTTKNDVYEGVIVYDLDEAMDSEILNGLNDNLEFSVPFKNIKKIEPKSYDYCLIELKTGENLYLGDQTDVSSTNAGVIVFKGENEYQLIKWTNIKLIEFM
nr:hypothetical protein [uncultured Marinifilum sp.]